MKQRSWAVRLGILLIGAVLLQANAVAEQPKMQQAIAYLEEAKTSTEPIPLLKKAKAELEGAKKNKGGRRVDAIATIDDAISTAETGGDAKAKIIKAIAMVRSGMTRGKN